MRPPTVLAELALKIGVVSIADGPPAKDLRCRGQTAHQLTNFSSGPNLWVSVDSGASRTPPSKQLYDMPSASMQRTPVHAKKVP